MAEAEPFRVQRLAAEAGDRVSHPGAGVAPPLNPKLGARPLSPLNLRARREGNTAEESPFNV